MGRTLDTNLLLKDQTQTRRRNILSYKNVLREIANIPEIVAAAPYASGQAIIVRGGEERGVTVRGIVTEREFKITNIKNYLIRGRIDRLFINDIAIGTGLADKLKVDLGRRISVTGPRGVNRTFRIVGIFSTGLKAQDEGQAFVSLKSGQQILQLGTSVTGIGVKVKDIYTADTISSIIRKKTGLNAKSWMEDNQQILDQITRFKLIIAFINFLIIFSAASSITSVFILLIASKSKEIGILKSMGAKNLSVMSIFLIQAIILSVIGYIAGLIGAKLLISWYTYIISASKGTFLTTGIPKITLNAQYAMLALFYSMFTSFLASIIPAYQAAKLNPVEAINA